MSQKDRTESYDSYGKNQKEQSKYLLDKKKHLCPFSPRVVLERIILVGDNHLKDCNSIKLNFRDINRSDDSSISKSFKKNKQNSNKITNNKINKYLKLNKNLKLNKKYQVNKIDNANVSSSKLDKLPTVILQRLSLNKIISCSTKRNNVTVFKSLIDSKSKSKIENNQTYKQITLKNKNEESAVDSRAILSEFKNKCISINNIFICEKKKSLKYIKADKISVKNVPHSISSFIENSEHQKEVNQSLEKLKKVEGYFQAEDLIKTNRNVKKKVIEKVKTNLIEPQNEPKNPLNDELNCHLNEEQITQNEKKQSVNNCKIILQTKVVLERLPKKKYAKRNKNDYTCIKDTLNDANPKIDDPVSEEAIMSFQKILPFEKKNSFKHHEIDANTSENNSNQKNELAINKSAKILPHNFKHCRDHINQKVEESVKNDSNDTVHTSCTSKRVLLTNTKKKTPALKTNLQNISRNYPLVLIKPISKDIFATRNPILNFEDKIPDNKLMSSRHRKISEEIQDSRKKLDVKAETKVLLVESKLSSTKDINVSVPEKNEVLSSVQKSDQLPSCCDCVNLNSTSSISSGNQIKLPASFKLDKQLIVCVKRLKDYSINSTNNTKNSYKLNTNKNYVVNKENKKIRNFNEYLSSALENKNLFSGNEDRDLKNVNSKNMHLQQIANEKSTSSTTCLNSISSQKLHTTSPKSTIHNENIEKDQKVNAPTFKFYNDRNNEYIKKPLLSFPPVFEKIEPLIIIQEKCKGLSDQDVKSPPLEFINASYCAVNDKPKGECSTVLENIKNLEHLVIGSGSEAESINVSKKNLVQEFSDNVMNTEKIHKNDDNSDDSSFIKALDAASVRKVIGRFKTYNGNQMPLIKELVPLLVKLKMKKNKNFQIKKRISMKAAVNEQKYNKNRCLAKKVIAKKRNLLKLKSTKNTNIDRKMVDCTKEEIQKTKDEKRIQKSCQTKYVQNTVESISVNESEQLKPNRKRKLVKSIVALDKPYDLNLFRRSPRKSSRYEGQCEKTAVVKKNLINSLLPETSQKFMNTNHNLEELNKEKSSSLLLQNKSNMLLKILEDWDDQGDFRSLRTDSELFRIDNMTTQLKLKVSNDVLVSKINYESQSENNGKQLPKINSTKKYTSKEEALVFNEDAKKVIDPNIHSIDKKTLDTTNFDIAQNIEVSSSDIQEKILIQELDHVQNDQVPCPLKKQTLNHSIKLDGFNEKHVSNQSIKDVHCEFTFEKKTDSTNTFDDGSQNKTHDQIKINNSATISSSFDENLIINENQNLSTEDIGEEIRNNYHVKRFINDVKLNKKQDVNSKKVELENYEPENKKTINIKETNLEMLKTGELKINEKKTDNKNEEHAGIEYCSNISNVDFTSKSISPTKIRITARKSYCKEYPKPNNVNVKDIAKITPKRRFTDKKLHLHKKFRNRHDFLTSELFSEDEMNKTIKKVDFSDSLKLESTETYKKLNSTIEERPMSEFEKFTEALQIRRKPIEETKQDHLFATEELGHIDSTLIKLEKKNNSCQNYREKTDIGHVNPFCQLKVLSEAIAILSKNNVKQIEQSTDPPFIKNYYNSNFVSETKDINKLKLMRQSLINKQSDEHKLFDEKFDSESTISNVSTIAEQNVQDSTTDSEYSDENAQILMDDHLKAGTFSKVNKNQKFVSHLTKTLKQNELHRDNVRNTMLQLEDKNSLTGHKLTDDCKKPNTSQIINDNSNIVNVSFWDKNSTQKKGIHSSFIKSNCRKLNSSAIGICQPIMTSKVNEESNEVTEEVIIYNEGMNIGAFDLLDHTYSRRRDDSEENIEDDSSIDSKSEEDFPEINNHWDEVSLQELKSSISSSNNKPIHNHPIEKSNCNKTFLPLHNPYNIKIGNSNIHRIECRKADAYLHRNEPLKCPKCDRTYMGKNRLKKHYYECGIPPIYHCPLCFYTARYKPSIIRHLKNEHSDEIVETNFEELLDAVQKKATEIRTKFKNQILAEETNQRIKSDQSNRLIRVPRSLKIYCPNCKEVFEKIPCNYEKFCSTCNINLMFNCNQCERRYILTNRISCHIQGKCRVCDQNDGIINEKPHVRKSFPKVKFIESETCSKGCGKKFKLRSTRLKHQRLCGRTRDLTCDFCPFKTKYQSAMKLHKQLHALKQDRKITSKIAEDEHSDHEQESKRIAQSIIAICPRCKCSVGPECNNDRCNSCGTLYYFCCQVCKKRYQYFENVQNDVCNHYKKMKFSYKKCDKYYT